MKRSWVVPFLLYLTMAVLLSPSAASGEGVFGYHDFRHHHLPWRSWAALQWMGGEIPWWAPGAANGFPLLAEGQGGFLYAPTMLLFLLLPDGLALNWSVLLHHVFAALGMWAFVSRLGLRNVAPLLAGVIYGFSGFMVSHSLYLGMQNGLAWLPWVLFGTLAGRGWLVALGIGASGLAGHPQAAAFSGLCVAFYALVHLPRAALIRWAGWAAAGVAIASPQLVASLELSRFSMRDGGVAAGFAGIGAMPVQELVGVVLPAAFGFDRPADVAETYFHRGLGYWGQGVNSWETCIYLGIPAVVLALAGARRSRFWSACLALAVLLMLGGPLWSLLRLLPGFTYFRFPARFALIAVAAAAVLAAYGLDGFRRAAQVRRVRLALWTAVGVFTLSTGVVRLALDTRATEIGAALSGYFVRQVVPLPPPPELSPLLAVLPPPEPENVSLIPAKVGRILADLVVSTDPRSSRVWLPVLLCILTAFALRRPRLLVALVAADLLWFARDYHPTVPFDSLATTPAWLSPRMTEAGGDRTTVLDRRIPVEFDDRLLTASLGLPLGTSDIVIPSPLLMVRNEALLALAGLDVGDKGAHKVERYLAHRDIARRMAVRFIATIHPFYGDGLVPLVRGTYTVVEDSLALPRVRVVPCTEWVATGDEALTALLRLDPEQTVVLEGSGTSTCAAGVGSATVSAYGNTRVSIHATGPGTLILADSWYPGWNATVDGAPVAIERADLINRAIALSPGEHEVEFRYQPGKLAWLLALSLGLVLATVGVGLKQGALANRGGPSGVR